MPDLPIVFLGIFSLAVILMVFKLKRRSRHPSSKHEHGHGDSSYTSCDTNLDSYGHCHLPGSDGCDGGSGDGGGGDGGGD